VLRQCCPGPPVSTNPKEGNNRDTHESNPDRTGCAGMTRFKKWVLQLAHLLLGLIEASVLMPVIVLFTGLQILIWWVARACGRSLDDVEDYTR
jgi:hypothetical protein